MQSPEVVTTWLGQVVFEPQPNGEFDNGNKIPNPIQNQMPIILYELFSIIIIIRISRTGCCIVLLLT